MPARAFTFKTLLKVGQRQHRFLKLTVGYGYDLDGIHDCEIFANLRLKLYNQTSFHSRASSDITNCIRTKWLEGVVEAEVEAAVDEDAGARDPEPAVEPQQAVCPYCLHVAIHDTCILYFC